MQSFEEVFDIYPCKCFDNKNRDCKQCQCNIKVLLLEWGFWLDQKGLRNMIIDNIGKKETKKLQNKFYRKSKEVHPVKNSISVASATTFYDDKINHDREVYIPTEFSSEDDKESLSSFEGSTKLSQNRHKYPNLCQIMECTGISNMHACQLINALLKDMKIDSADNILKQTKLQRQQDFWKNKNIETHKKSRL